MGKSKSFLTTYFILSLIFFIVPVYASNEDLLYQESEVQTVTDGLTYEKSSRLYKSGWKDIYILTADINNENISFEVIESQTEYGLKKSVEALAKENNVVAAVNGDFFGSGNPTSSMGQVVRDGNINQTQNYYNGSENRYAGIFIDKYGSAFIDYLKTSIGLYSSSNNAIELQAKNKVYTNFSKPVYFDINAIETTADLDKRVKKLYKIVVENGVITKISKEGETVSVPEKGYIIVMNSETASQKLSQFSVGQSVSFSESGTFLFRPTKKVEEILTGISGGGEILRNGQIISQGLSVSPNARNPRTIVGVNKNKDKVFIVAIDGRGESLGATHKEAAEILLEYGVYDAIHLDGGGSTTLVVRPEGQDNLIVDNKVSENVQRLVPNAIGIKTNSAKGSIESFTIKINETDDNLIISNLPYTVSVSGFDNNKNPVSLNLEDVEFYFENDEVGVFDKNKFTALKQGKHNIKAKYGEIYSNLEINVLSPFIALNPRASKASLEIGEKTYITSSVINQEGFERDLNYKDIIWEIENSNIGYIEEGYFYAKGEGITKVNATYGGITASIEISVGKTSLPLENFEKTRNLYMMYYPANKGIKGGAGVTNATHIQGSNSLLLSYDFPKSTTTQVSYVCFDKQPININQAAKEIGLWVKGDNSENLLKMTLKDSENKIQNVTITEKLNFNDWKYFRVDIPKDLKQPITLDKIYVASLSSNNVNKGTVYIDDITQLISRNDGGKVLNTYKDNLNKNLEGTKPSNLEEDITIFGQTEVKPFNSSQEVLQKVISKMKVDARAMVFAGGTSIPTIKDIPTVSWNNKYYTTNTSYVSIINLATKSGNMRTESPNQWRWLQSYLKNFSKNNIIINMDKNIWSSLESLKGTRENELLHKILKDFVIETGKNVIVISATGNTSSVKVKDGVRYINLNGLTVSNENSLNGYKYVRIRANENSLNYELCEMK